MVLFYKQKGIHLHSLPRLLMLIFVLFFHGELVCLGPQHRFPQFGIAVTGIVFSDRCKNGGETCFLRFPCCPRPFRCRAIQNGEAILIVSLVAVPSFVPTVGINLGSSHTELPAVLFTSLLGWEVIPAASGDTSQTAVFSVETSNKLYKLTTAPRVPQQVVGMRTSDFVMLLAYGSDYQSAWFPQPRNYPRSCSPSFQDMWSFYSEGHDIQVLPSCSPIA